MEDDEFEWDDAKVVSNLADHKVSFVLARRAFADVFAVEREDITEDYGEYRYTLLSMVDGRVLLVAYKMRGDSIRIISKAEPYERRLYHEENAR
jgi:uncharacterized DUF497 family protein